MARVFGTRNYERDVLQTVIQYGIIASFELPELAGWPEGTVRRALSNLKADGLLELGPGEWRATERGKIALALLHGQQAKRRAHFVGGDWR